jgi:tetratricopeptide (TPR) repeat protein
LFLVTLACALGGSEGDDHVDKGMAAYDAEDYALAAQELEQAIAKGVTENKLEDIYAALGNCYLELDRYEAAIEAQEKALDLDPNYYKAWVNMGIAYRLMGDLEQAEASYNQALAIEPDYAELHASLGVLHIVKEEPEQAIMVLEKAIALDPDLAVAHANIALAYALANRFDEAEAALRQAAALGYKDSVTIQERIDNLKALQR